MRGCVVGPCGLLALLGGAGCGFSSHTPPDAGLDSGPVCADPDGDGFGVGDGCAGTDCREDDPTTHECVCDAEGLGTGCPCDDAVTPRICYEGPDGTAGVGACEIGLRTCRDRRWSACERQQLPADETCNGADDDCDGVIDDGVLSACGTCSPCSEQTFGVDGAPLPADDPDLATRDDGAVTLDPGGRLSGELSLVLGEESWCPPAWGDLELLASVPEGATLAVWSRGADRRDDLAAASWNAVLGMPGDDTRAPLFPRGEEQWAFVEIRIRLEADRADAVPVLEWVTIGSSYVSCTD